MEKQNDDTGKMHSSLERTDSLESVTSIQNKSKNTWRSPLLSNLVSPRKKSTSSILSSRKSIGSLKDEMTNEKSTVSPLTIVPRKASSSNLNRNSILTIVLVGAKCLPPVPEDGAAHSIYCKFRLGTETYKTKAVTNTAQPEWRERFKMHIYNDELLKISVWDKGKQKNLTGSCVIDLSSFERERTHTMWQQLDDGYGKINLSITMCTTRPDNSTTSCVFNLKEFQQRHFEGCCSRDAQEYEANNLVLRSGNATVTEFEAIFNMSSNWEIVGLLHVNVISGRGLAGKPKAYCTLELDNERVQTPTGKTGSEPTWNKCYVFNVYDVTSTLDLKVYDSSLTTALMNESLGKVSIPLLRIVNGQQRWFTLKDKNKRNLAKGNCPRVCLQMTLIWNPVKASVRLFRPKQARHVKKPPKFDMALLYSNILFVENVYNFLYDVNESFKRVFEWEDRESSFIALVGWLAFCSYFQLWAVPLLLLLPFFYHWFTNRHQDNRYHIMHAYSNPADEVTKTNKAKEDKSLSEKVHDLQKMTITVANGTGYLASVADRLFNLISFKVPFLSLLAMVILATSAFVFYFVPFNYLLMILGIYKFTRKYLNPDRVLNNDLLDFISRIPDSEILNDWKELSVPEPVQRQSSGKLARSIGTEELS